MKPELEVLKNTEWQEQISHNSVPAAFRSLPWSFQGRIVKESSNITKYSPESGDLWWSLMLNGETNLTCITVTSQCDQYVATMINHWHPNHGLWLVNDLHTHRSLWICYMSHGHANKVMEHVSWHDHTWGGGEIAMLWNYPRGGKNPDIGFRLR